jgi:hypothetical protein
LAAETGKSEVLTGCFSAVLTSNDMVDLEPKNVTVLRHLAVALSQAPTEANDEGANADTMLITHLISDQQPVQFNAYPQDTHHCVPLF